MSAQDGRATAGGAPGALLFEPGAAQDARRVGDGALLAAIIRVEAAWLRAQAAAGAL
ncbi:hypothetical protein GSY69_04520, partial [Brevibacterium sp. 5221]|nr:hypothetical protein [Brevibacterium rongguiense]